MKYMYRKQLSSIIASVIQTDRELEEVKQEIIEDYQKLNEKCDHIISKIKTRKNKQEK